MQLKNEYIFLIFFGDCCSNILDFFRSIAIFKQIAYGRFGPPAYRLAGTTYQNRKLSFAPPFAKGGCLPAGRQEGIWKCIFYVIKSWV
jgi:hypothetical protein